MPKELFEIKSFLKGTMTNPDSADIPDEAAQHSLNVDPVSVDGALSTIKNEQILSPSGFVDSGLSVAHVSGECHAMGILSSSVGEKALVLYNKDTDSIVYMEDIYGSQSGGIEDAPSSSTSDDVRVTMNANNKEIHVGLGNSLSSPTKWLGYISHKQFGEEAIGIQEENDALKSSDSFEELYEVVDDASYIYGISYKGSNIFSIKKTDMSIIKHSSFPVVSAQGLAMDTDEKLW